MVHAIQFKFAPFILLQETQFRAHLINSFHSSAKMQLHFSLRFQQVRHLTNIPERDQILNRLTDINDTITSGPDLSLVLICPHVLISTDLSFYEDRYGGCDVELNTAVNPFHGVFFGKLGMIKHLRWTLVCFTLCSTKNKQKTISNQRLFIIVIQYRNFYANKVFSVCGNLIL